ncbi:hypothetical protein DTO027I6_9977 [Penicillium roqueforti]|nr:hypothetical protein CBS147337_10087 [Penicillium roqueforti]KAI3184480.1 hypothetical protein DTO027I6_9977 [Penicillium roqueforti]
MIFLTITWLALASLNSATVHSAAVLRDHAKSDLVTLSDTILILTFQNLMDDVIDGMVIAALVSALFSIFGFVLVTYLNWLQENCAARFYYWCFQIVVSKIVQPECVLFGQRHPASCRGHDLPWCAHLDVYRSEIIDDSTYKLEMKSFNADKGNGSRYLRELYLSKKRTNCEVAKNLFGREWVTEKLEKGGSSYHRGCFSHWRCFHGSIGYSICQIKFLSQRQVFVPKLFAYGISQ